MENGQARIAEKARLTATRVHHWHALFKASKRVVDECSGEGCIRLAWGTCSTSDIAMQRFDDKLPK